jgi:hypothetical protein
MCCSTCEQAATATQQQQLHLHTYGDLAAIDVLLLLLLLHTTKHSTTLQAPMPACTNQLPYPHLHVNEHLVAVDVLLDDSINISLTHRLLLVLGLEVIVAVFTRHDREAAQLLLQLLGHPAS